MKLSNIDEYLSENKSNNYFFDYTKGLGKTKSGKKVYIDAIDPRHSKYEPKDHKDAVKMLNNLINDLYDNDDVSLDYPSPGDTFITYLKYQIRIHKQIAGAKPHIKSLSKNFKF